MLSFNRFQYYNLPQLSNEHRFPEWFRIELGILAGWVLGTQPKWVGPPNLADVLGRTKYPKPSLGS
jgi:hypothetical protein